MNADADALDAAADAGVTVRTVEDLPALLELQRLIDRIWQAGNPLVSAEMLRALTKAGNYAAAAYDRDGTMVGACLGFFASPARRELHSHIAGVTGALRGRGVGRALKMHQRAWALRQGVDVVTWTFDPLVSRNAYVNIVKLGGRPVEYLPDFYGSMRDGINGDGETDRLLLRWDLTAEPPPPGVWDAAALRAAGSPVVLDRTPGGEPAAGTPHGTGPALVAVPPDIEGLRRTDPACAGRWRTAVREALQPLLADGAQVRGFDRAGWYVVYARSSEGNR